MAEVLGAATSATKVFLEVNQISIDNFTFKLFYKATTSLLIASSVIASSKQFFGEPINCEVSGGGVSQSVLDSYCWMYSTFNIPLDFSGACAKREHDGTVLYNSYYQWVSLFLAVSAICFYLPRAIWLMAEGGLMKFLAKGNTTKIIEDADEKRDKLFNTFQEHLHNKYNAYAFWFFFCEQLNFVMVLSQWFITNKFLKYKFLSYGPSVIQYYQTPPELRQRLEFNPMCEAFPRIAACNYHRYGSGGGQENKNAICILGLNMINDKIFLILWFWYFFLTFFGILRLLYRIIQLTSKHFRYYIMKVRINRYFKTNASMKHVKHYTMHCSIGDWFVLYQMSRNMNTRFFAEFLVVLSRQVNPCPDLDEDTACEQLIYKTLPNGTIKRNDSSLSLHSKILDLTYEPDSAEEDQKDNKKKDCHDNKDNKDNKDNVNQLDATSAKSDNEDDDDDKSLCKMDRKKSRECEDHGSLEVVAVATKRERSDQEEEEDDELSDLVPKRGSARKGGYFRNKKFK